MKSKIRYISFDAAGTLIRVRKTVGEMYADVASQFGVKLDPVQLESEFKQSFHGASPLCFPEIDSVNEPAKLLDAERDWWRGIVRRVFRQHFMKSDEFELFFDVLYKTFSKPEAWALFDDVMPTLTELKLLHLQFVVVSNFDSRLHQILKDLKISAYFDKVVCSSEVGAAKPNPEIFKKGLPPHWPLEQILHVGDHLSLDVEPAETYGIRGLWLDRHSDATAAAADALSEVKISSLREIFRYL